MNNEYNLLAGSTEEGNFIFVNVSFERKSFTMSADEIAPTFWTEDEKEQYYSDMADDLDAMTKVDLLERFDVKPSELAGTLADIEDFSDTLDCSLTPSHLRHLNGTEADSGEELYLQSVGCGQHTDFTIENHFLNKADLAFLMDVWEAYHMADALPEDVEERVKSILGTYFTDDSDEREAKFITEEAAQ